jgi:O-antigen ligase
MILHCCNTFVFLDLQDQYSYSSTMSTQCLIKHNRLKIIRENPLFGVGIGGFINAYKKQVKNSPMVATDKPHNQYPLTAVELGLVGLGVLLLLFVVQWHSAIRLPGKQVRMLAYALILAIITGSLFNVFLADHTEAFFYIWVIGILFSDPFSSLGVKVIS